MFFSRASQRKAGLLLFLLVLIPGKYHWAGYKDGGVGSQLYPWVTVGTNRNNVTVGKLEMGLPPITTMLATCTY